MDFGMIKKFAGFGLIGGGVIAFLGTIITFVNMGSLDANGIMGAAIMTRIGCIVLFIAAAATVGAVVMSKGKLTGGVIAIGIFGVLAFIAQFLFNPITSVSAAAGSLSDIDTAAGGTVIGLILSLVSGFTCALIGLVGVLKKKGSN